MSAQIIYNAALAELVKGGMPNARFLANAMVAHSKIETANYTSNVYRKNNNAFGYKYVRGARWQLGPGTAAPKSEGSTPYARYASVADSAREVAHWILRRKAKFLAVDTESEYSVVLKQNGYYGASLESHIAGMQRYFKEYGGNMALWAAVAGVGFILYNTI